MHDPDIINNNALKGVRVLIAVGGGIAVYKVVEVVRLLLKRGANVRVMMTRTATRFVCPATFSAISGQDVGLTMFHDDGRPNLLHLELPHQADLILVAPATADLIAKMSHGIADDLVSTALLAAKCPIVYAPAMNSSMWENPATLDNNRKLQERGLYQVGPETGEMASPDEEPGMGRMSEPAAIVAYINSLFSKKKDLLNKKILITAGRTEEDIDRVRVLTNKSSGRMGCALALEALERGAEVVLIHGPMDIEPPPGSRNIKIRSALELLEKVKEEILVADIVIYAAAVADWRPGNSYNGKLKREKSLPAPIIELVENPDIAKETSSICKGIKIGFALEESENQKFAIEKMNKKGLNAILLNTIEAIGSSDNALTWFDDRNRINSIDMSNKTRVAEWLFNQVIRY